MRNLYCFTPSYFDIKPFLNPEGHDYEKLRYIPGIYDNLEITLSNRPYIENVQCVPDVKNARLQAVAELETDQLRDMRW